jgi:hypothetical protein
MPLPSHVQTTILYQERTLRELLLSFIVQWLKRNCGVLYHGSKLAKLWNFVNLDDLWLFAWVSLWGTRGHGRIQRIGAFFCLLRV